MRSIIFDMDNTLYDAEQYFSGALTAIAAYLSEKYSLPYGDLYRVSMACWKTKTSMYPRLFNDILEPYGLESELSTVLRLFNSGDYPLEPYAGVRETLTRLRNSGEKLGVITDGQPGRQRKKLESLKLTGYFDIILYTRDLHCSKPSVIPYQEMVRLLGVSPRQSYYVGDNPSVDFEGARRAGMITVRVKQGEFKAVGTNQYIDHEIENISDLMGILTYG